MKNYFLYSVFLVLLVASKCVYASGDPYSFSVDMPRFFIGEIEFKKGKYIFNVRQPDNVCEIEIYNLKSYHLKKAIASGLKAACLVGYKLDEEVMVGFVPLKEGSGEGIVYYKTPDYGIRKTRTILLPVSLIE